MSSDDGFSVPTWQDLREIADHNFRLYANTAAELRSLWGVVQAARAKLAEPDKWHRYEPRELGEAFLADVVLDWRDDVLAVLAAAADAPQPERGSQR